MRITLTRNYSAQDISRGTIEVEGHPEFRLLCLEAALPRNLEKYIGHTLPPGTYKCEVEICPIEYKGVYLRMPWISICNVPWFPNACFVLVDKTFAPRLGQIFIGAEYTDNGFTVVNPNDEGMKTWARISAIAYENHEDIELVIKHSDDLVFEDTYKDKARKEAEERAENLRRDELMRDLLGRTELCETSWL